MATLRGGSAPQRRLYSRGAPLKPAWVARVGVWGRREDGGGRCGEGDGDGSDGCGVCGVGRVWCGVVWCGEGGVGWGVGRGGEIFIILHSVALQSLQNVVDERLLGGDGGFQFRNPRLIRLLLSVYFLEGGGGDIVYMFCVYLVKIIYRLPV